jgi:hypothetical protein
MAPQLGVIVDVGLPPAAANRCARRWSLWAPQTIVERPSVLRAAEHGCGPAVLAKLGRSLPISIRSRSSYSRTSNPSPNRAGLDPTAVASADSASAVARDVEVQRVRAGR